MEAIIAQVVGGAIGGNGAGKLLSGANMGSLGNTIAGAVGGLGGGSILGGLMGGTGAIASGAADTVAPGLDIVAMVGQLAGGGVGGLVMTVVVGMLKNKFMG
ncbi:MAG: hypothetical protein P8H36_03710 [Yoonia sp.]|nr:hypothetical protein [Yoonia sp.]